MNNRFSGRKSDLKIYTIIAAIVLLFVICAVFIALGEDRGGDYVLITSNGEVVEKIDLANSPDRTFVVENELGRNTICVMDGKISVIDADCPDRTCIAMGALESELMPIVCLPHRLIISFTEK